MVCHSFWRANAVRVRLATEMILCGDETKAMLRYLPIMPHLQNLFFVDMHLKDVDLSSISLKMLGLINCEVARITPPRSLERFEISSSLVRSPLNLAHLNLHTLSLSGEFVHITLPRHTDKMNRLDLCFDFLETKEPEPEREAQFWHDLNLDHFLSQPFPELLVLDLHQYAVKPFDSFQHMPQLDVLSTLASCLTPAMSTIRGLRVFVDQSYPLLDHLEHLEVLSLDYTDAQESFQVAVPFGVKSLIVRTKCFDVVHLDELSQNLDYFFVYHDEPHFKAWQHFCAETAPSHLSRFYVDQPSAEKLLDPAYVQFYQQFRAHIAEQGLDPLFADDAENPNIDLFDERPDLKQALLDVDPSDHKLFWWKDLNMNGIWN